MDLTCNLIRILDCDFIVELLVDPNLDKTIVGSADFASNLGGSADLYTPIPPPPPLIISEKLCLSGKCCPWPFLKHGTHDAHDLLYRSTLPVINFLFLNNSFFHLRIFNIQKTGRLPWMAMGPFSRLTVRTLPFSFWVFDLFN